MAPDYDHLSLNERRARQPVGVIAARLRRHRSTLSQAPEAGSVSKCEMSLLIRSMISAVTDTTQNRVPAVDFTL